MIKRLFGSMKDLLVLHKHQLQNIIDASNNDLSQDTRKGRRRMSQGCTKEGGRDNSRIGRLMMHGVEEGVTQGAAEQSQQEKARKGAQISTHRRLLS